MARAVHAMRAMSGRIARYGEARRLVDRIAGNAAGGSPTDRAA